MCNPLMFLAAGTTMQIAGNIQQGKAQQRAANEDAALREYEALAEQDDALYQAQQIRRAGERARGETLAGVAASGVKVGEGSALDAERRVMEDTELDARMAILSGERAARSLRMGAELTRRAGRDARRSANASAVGSLLSAGGKYFTGGFGG
jgi:hypothetical protein